MKIRDIITEDLGQAVASAIIGATDAMMNIFDVPPTKRMAAVDAMVKQWDEEWAGIVRKDPSAKKSYGLALQAWLQGMFKKDLSMKKHVDRTLDVSKTVQNGKPNVAYIKSVFGSVFDAHKKRQQAVDKRPLSAKPTVRMKAATAK